MNNIRERAREVGGDALVAKIDRGRAIQDTMETMVKDAIEQALKENEDDPMLVWVSACEAMSEMLALASTNLGMERGEATITAVRSINGNISRAFDTKEAEGIGDLIKTVAKKGGQ